MGADAASSFINTGRAPRTTCKICWCAIYATDDTVWVVTPNPGIAHRVCAEDQRPRTP